MSRKSYTARASREDGWWVIEVPTPGRTVRTQAKRLDQIDAVAREAVAMSLDLAEDSFDVEVDVDVPADITDQIAAFRAEQAEAEAAAARASQRARSVVAELHRQGLTTRDSGRLLNISHQRVAQLLTDA